MVSAAPPPPILIAGATASGKSAVALALAARVGGVIINADSMQVYRELPILTAQPSAAEQARVPHWLYGHIAAAEAYSTGRFLADVAAALQEARAAGLRPIIVGGTGLYFKALLEGLSPIPAIDARVRERWRAEAMVSAAGDLHRMLAARDPVMARRLNPADKQRITRALEVIEATGTSLAVWQATAGAPLIDADTAVKLVITRTRSALHARSDERFDQMMAAGALAEVAELAAQKLATTLPAMRALGVRPLCDHLDGGVSLAEAVAKGKLETRQYVKRQQTWLKRNMMSWSPIFEQQMESLIETIAPIV